MSPTEDHPLFTPPPNPNIKVWRYMDFGKYVSLLLEGGLWFSRSDLLNDRFEGSRSRASLMMQRYGFELTEWPPFLIDKVERRRAHDTEHQREHAYVNSWHMNERESAAMWEIYAGSGEAVAIQSTYSLLRASLPARTKVHEVVHPDANPWQVFTDMVEVHFDERGNKVITSSAQVYLGTINYIDYAVEPIPWGNTFYPYIHKRKSFEHERELRAVMLSDPFAESAKTDEHGQPPPRIPNLATGQMVRMPIEDLIEAVYVAPTAPDYFYKVVESVTNQYGFAHKPVIRSSLAEDPVY